MERTDNLQRDFLRSVCQGRKPVTVFLMNGFQMRGVIVDFDSEAIILDSDGRKQFIFKHAISTIAPLQLPRMEEGAALNPG